MGNDSGTMIWTRDAYSRLSGSLWASHPFTHPKPFHSLLNLDAKWASMESWLCSLCCGLLCEGLGQTQSVRLAGALGTHPPGLPRADWVCGGF